MCIVIKCGGRGDLDFAAVSTDVAALVRGGQQVVVVHGGSADIDDLGDRLGVTRRRLEAPDGTTTRYTDGPTLEAVTLALLGSVKPRLVGALTALGVRAVSMSGLDARVVTARRKSAVRAVVDGRTVIVRDNFAGRIDHVDAELLNSMHAVGLVPVLSPPAVTDCGQVLNVDADRLAAGLAVALNSSHLVLLTSTPGLLADPQDPTSLIGVLLHDRSSLPAAAVGGMRMKLVAAGEALDGGVQSVHIADGRVERPVMKALAGAGTRIHQGRADAVVRSA
jgi:acetylglutamate/LysW-gamma-L-alpha-aminoadipate kinase